MFTHLHTVLSNGHDERLLKPLEVGLWVEQAIGMVDAEAGYFIAPAMSRIKAWVAGEDFLTVRAQARPAR